MVNVEGTVAQTPDGGYVLTGWEAKTIDDRDVIIIKTDEVGEVEWSRTWDLDPGERDGAFDLILTSDGHVVVACIRSMNNGPRRAVLIKVDLDGNEIWVKEFGDEGVGSEFWDIMEDSDGGYVMAGDMIPGRNPATGEDIRRGLVIKTDPDGEVLWQYVFDEDEYEEISFSSAVVLPDGGYVFVGRVTRKGERYADMLWLKLTTNAEGHRSASHAFFTAEGAETAEKWTSCQLVLQGCFQNRMSNYSSEIDRILCCHHTDDPAIIEEMIKRCYATVYRVAVSILHDPEEAKDATQDTFITAMTKLDQYQVGTNFRAWLYTIAVNTCRGYLRFSTVHFQTSS